MPRAGLTPDGLAVTAADLADEVGLDAVTISELARRVGVRPASLYGHLAGTDDLRVRVAQLALAELADEVADQVAGRSGRDAVAALARTYGDYARRHPGRYAATRTRLDHEQALSGAGPRHTALLTAVLRGYPLPTSEHVHAVRVLGAAIHGFTELAAAGSYDHSTPPADTTRERLADALDAMLRAWPTPPADGQ